MNTRILVNTRILTIALSFAASGLVGCASGPTSGGSHMSEHAVNHQSTPEDLAALESAKAVTAPNVVLWVNGLGCPQCASNVDAQLERLPGVVSVATDLSNGKIDVVLTGSRRPSPSQFKEAIEDAGFTLVKLEEAKLASG